ncbi:MAG: nickel-dependent lactate racemase [Acidobacteriia bacterium]|nr:nickel-dependent lactate racemase [Terriglobia bacterium]
MIVDLLYGRNLLPVRFPEHAEVTVIRKRSLPKLPDEQGAIRRALNAPIGSPPFHELVKGRRSACILICDITRPVPNRLFLRPMIEGLIAGGISADKITVLVATGLHRPNVGAELEEVVGDRWVLSTVRVVNHMARVDADHVDLGRTASRGTPVKIDRRFVEADLRIATGLVEPHFMAGYSGGRKVVAPGIAHADTIRTLHSARFMEDQLTVQCNLTNNPLHEEQLEIVGMIGEIVGLNTVINEDRHLSYVSFGEIVQSHLAAVDFVRTSTEVPVPRRFKTIVTSAAGYPLDKTYYQTIKGMVTPLDILDQDGTLIIASACSEGMGSSEFCEAQRRLVEKGAGAFLESLTPKLLADVDEWQTEMQLKPMRKGRVAMYTEGLSDEERRMTGVALVASIEDAVHDSITRAGDNAIAVIPEGPYVVPHCTAPAHFER